MKYAFIALIACYLLVYGCGPDNSQKTDDKKDQAIHSTTKTPSPPAQPTQAAPPPPQDSGSQPVVKNVTLPQPAQPQAEVSQQPPVTAPEQKTGETAERVQQHPCNMMVQQQGAVELTQPDEENIVVMPCGCMFVKHKAANTAPCLKLRLPPCPMMGENQSEDEEDLIMMPCGRVFARPPRSDEDPDLDQSQMTETPGQDATQPQGTEESQEDLTSAVRRMVETTNDMVLVTKELVLATQEMLKATKGAANKVADASTENLQNGQPVQTTRQEAVAGVKKQPATREEEVTNAMKDAVIATQKALEAMNQATPKTLQPNQ
jgi:hypothetical protein